MLSLWFINMFRRDRPAGLIACEKDANFPILHHACANGGISKGCSTTELITTCSFGNQILGTGGKTKTLVAVG